METNWVALDRNAYDYLGFLPEIIGIADHGTVAEEIARNYAHGGGYMPFGEGKWKFDPVKHTLRYPGDPVLTPKASAQIRNETVYVYEAAIVAIVQKDGTFAVTRMD